MNNRSELYFHKTFFDDAVISPIDRRILLLEIGILSHIAPDGDSLRPYLDKLPLSDIVRLLARHNCSLKVVPDAPAPELTDGDDQNVRSGSDAALRSERVGQE